jgi:hypothetical protein
MKKSKVARSISNSTEKIFFAKDQCEKKAKKKRSTSYETTLEKKKKKNIN